MSGAVFLSVQVLLSASFVASQVYEFCADNQLFAFANEACPGGVVFKKPIELTEPCFCVNEQLVAYSTCDFQNATQLQTKVCRPLHKPIKGGLVKLLQPKKTFGNGSENVKHKHRDSKCHRFLNKCTKLESNSALGPRPVNSSKSLTRTYQNRKNYRQKRSLSIAKVTNEKLKERIQETIDLLNELQFGSTNIIRPKSMSFQLLAKTIKIFNHITPSAIVEDEAITSILSLFLKKYADLELPGYSGRLLVDDRLEREMFENVMGSLQECASMASDSSQEFEFATIPGTCPPIITHVIHKVSTFESGFQRIRYELGNFLPDDRKYVAEVEDLVLGALWKVFDAVYSYCFSSAFSYRTSQTQNNYFTIISNIFSSPWTVNDYFSEHSQGTSMYNSRIEHENLTVLMKNLDFMTEAVHLLSRYKIFFQKPVKKSNGDDVNRSKREHESESSEHFTTTSTITTTESAIFRNRNKRSADSNQTGVDREIFGGRAYCLQLSDPALPASVANTVPSLKDLCAST